MFCCFCNVQRFNNISDIPFKTGACQSLIGPAACLNQGSQVSLTGGYSDLPRQPPAPQGRPEASILPAGEYAHSCRGELGASNPPHLTATLSGPLHTLSLYQVPGSPTCVARTCPAHTLAACPGQPGPSSRSPQAQAGPNHLRSLLGEGSPTPQNFSEWLL